MFKIYAGFLFIDLARVVRTRCDNGSPCDKPTWQGQCCQTVELPGCLVLHP